ncbi:MAG: methyltransferase [Phycisphaerae bacterium]|nr:methyltransferase [Phycisphaerae bacterium]
MTSRERVFRTLEFKVPERAPRQLWRLYWVDGFAADELKSLLREFPEDFTAPGQVLAPGERQSGQKGLKGTYVDDWGCVWEAGEDSVIGEVKHPPLADFSAMDGFSPPWEIIGKADWDEVNRAQEKNLAGERKFMLCGTSVRPFERIQFLRGTERLFLDMGYGSVEFRRLLEMVHEFYLKELEGWAGTDCDGVSFMDDWGSQESLLISPAMWRELFKPLYKDYCEIIHGSGKKFFMHSDGHITDIYEDLIEVGVDAINSQLFCMDIEALGRRFKGRITFWGEIDRQHVLPFGTVEDVYKAVGRVRRALDGGNGGVIAQCEWVPNNPPENVRAAFEAWSTPINELP